MSAPVVPKFNVNVPEWDRAFVKWVSVANMSIRDAMRTQARLLFERIINWKGGAIATPPKSVAQGKGAVQRDIYRAVFPLRAEGFNNPRTKKSVKRVLDEQNWVGLGEMVKRGVFGQNLKGAFVAAFNPMMHKSQRRSRGRVPRTSSKSYKYATMDVKELKDYIKKKQGNVGQGKGGWAAALVRLGGKPAAWIAKHAKHGTFEDRLQVRGKPEFVGINRSAWAKGGDEDRIIAMAMQGRVIAMERDIERRLADEWGKRR